MSSQEIPPPTAAARVRGEDSDDQIRWAVAAPAIVESLTYALVVADSLLHAGHRRCLIIGAETLSKVTDQDDRTTAVLFGEAELEHGYDITRAAPLRKQAESSPRSPPISTRQHDDG